jgi:Methyltransferase FkbM domain
MSFFYKCDSHSKVIYSKYELAHGSTMRVLNNLNNVNMLLQAYVFDGCLSIERRPQYIEFAAAEGLGGIESKMNPAQRSWMGSTERYRLTCFPLTDVLRAIDVKHVEFFSLDIQGAELEVLKTIDFKEFRIDILMIEVEHPDSTTLEKMRSEMRKLFNETGLYKENSAPHERDLVFMRTDIPN